MLLKILQRNLLAKQFLFWSNQNLTYQVYHRLRKLSILHYKSICFSVNHSKMFCSSALMKDGTTCHLKPDLQLESLEEIDITNIKEKFKLNDLKKETLIKYNIKVSQDSRSLYFPFDSLDKDFAAFEFLTHKIEGGRCVHTSSGKSSLDLLFGWSLIGDHHKEIVVTSNPLDALAVHQETGMPAVSLPQDFTCFSSKVLDALKSFSKVIFWLNPHLHSSEIHQILAETLGKHAFFICPGDFPAAFQSLQCDSNLKHILLESFSLYNENFEPVSSYEDVIYDEIIEHEKYAGLKWRRFSILNEVLKGHRLGELTVFSGQTGSGKTTFMTEYSLDLCMQGRPTLWANFEISNSRLLRVMLSQHSKCSLEELKQNYKQKFESFSKIRMFVLNCHKARTLKSILKAMSDCVKIHRIQHIVVDNLQFMMNMEDFNSFGDQYRRQDQIFAEFRKFATQHHCHVTIVIHPRKEPEFTELNNTSISGTSKATQEADNILILQTTKTKQYLQVTKNRFDGCKGCIVLEFKPKTLTFSVKQAFPN